MAILLDTHILVWIALSDPRIGQAAAAAIADPDERILVSAVTAYEFVDLNGRGRFAADLSFAGLVDRLDAKVIDYPADAWRTVATLPPLHRDPIDRMVIAHAIVSSLVLVTADATVRRYPVATIW